MLGKTFESPFDCQDIQPIKPKETIKNLHCFPVNKFFRHKEYTYGHGESGGEDEIYGKSNIET